MGKKMLTKHKKGNIVGRKKRMEKFCPSNHIKQKLCQQSQSI